MSIAQRRAAFELNCPGVQMTELSREEVPPVLREIAYADKVTVLALYAPWSPQRYL